MTQTRGKTSVKGKAPEKVQLWKQAEQKSLKNGTLSAILMLNGDTYEGDWVNDQKEGKKLPLFECIGHGKYVWKSGAEYEGGIGISKCSSSIKSGKTEVEKERVYIMNLEIKQEKFFFDMMVNGKMILRT